MDSIFEQKVSPCVSEPNHSSDSKMQLSAFNYHLRESEKQQATIEKYMRDVAGFLSFCGEINIAKKVVMEYKADLVKKGYAVRSINSMLASVNVYLDFIGRSDAKVKSLKLQQQAFCSENQELSRREYEKLCLAAKQKKNERINLIMQTICSTGIRVSELRFITVEAVNRGEAQVSCKGKNRSVFIVRALQKLLQSYIRKQKVESGAVFRTRTGKPIDRIMVWREMKALCKAADVCPQKVFPHNLRHLFARVFYSIEQDIAKLADILGHSNINTTRIYIISTGLEHRRKMEKMRLIL